MAETSVQGTETNVENTEQTEVETETETRQEETPDQSAELKRLKEELARSKAAIDKATKEAADFKRQLRSKQTADEVAAEEARAANEARDKELTELRKQFAVMESTKKVMGLGFEEATAGKVAEYLHGAEDIDAALAEFQKYWTAKEKAIRKEFGKVTGPGIGAGDGPTITREQLDGMKYLERVDFANKHPEEYAKLMGR